MTDQPWHRDGAAAQGANPSGTAQVEAVGAGRSRPVTVLIVEDSRHVRERLVALVESVPEVTIVGPAVDGHHASALFASDRPDAVVLDLRLPGINGLDLLAQFKHEHPACVVMVLTTYAFTEFRQRCFKLGADHFFNKATEFERVTDVLGAMTSGQTAKSRP